MLKDGIVMSRLQAKLPDMVALAHERTEAARIELAGMLADICLGNANELSLREQEQVNELIEVLLRTNSPVLRLHLAERFSDVTKMPHALAADLAKDTIDVAAKVLTDCETLTDTDLISVIEGQSHDHAAAIARRASVNEAVADALVTTGDINVMRIVAENLGAKLSPKAITVVADTARFTATLREPIMKRPEMFADAALRLYWWVSPDLRRYTLKRFNISAGQIDRALAKTVDDLLSYHQLDKSNSDIMEQIANWLQEREAMAPRILPQVLRLGHFRLFNIILSRLTELSLDVIDIIVAESGGRELAVVCRGLGIDKAGFVSIFLLSRGARQDEQVVHPQELSRALAAFDRLTTNLAHDLLNSWKLDPSYILKTGMEGLALEA